LRCAACLCPSPSRSLSYLTPPTPPHTPHIPPPTPTHIIHTTHNHSQANKSFKALLGAILFIASDTVLAFSRFAPSVVDFHGRSHEIVMVTYYLAQYLITSSLN